MTRQYRLMHCENFLIKYFVYFDKVSALQRFKINNTICIIS